HVTLMVVRGALQFGWCVGRGCALVKHGDGGLELIWTRGIEMQRSESEFWKRRRARSDRARERKRRERWRRPGNHIVVGIPAGSGDSAFHCRLTGVGIFAWSGNGEKERGRDL